MHELLIRANIAFYKGEHSEVGRLLSAYRAQGSPDPAHGSMVLWLEAQLQPDQDDRLRYLREMVTGGASDPYTGMAREYLAEEEAYERDQRQRIPVPRATRWVQAVILIALGAMLTVVGSLLLGQKRTPTVQTIVVTATPPPDEQATALALPDQSQQLLGDGFQARYAGGVLQLRAVEDRSARVVDTRTGQIISPVPGARFYALLAAFECRDSICEKPPEAEISLQTDSDDVIPLREEVNLYGEAAMQPIALGRTTEGWLVFEMPVTFRPQTLIITPVLADGSRGDPATITLTAEP